MSVIPVLSNPTTIKMREGVKLKQFFSNHLSKLALYKVMLVSFLWLGRMILCILFRNIKGIRHSWRGDFRLTLFLCMCLISVTSYSQIGIFSTVPRYLFINSVPEWEIFPEYRVNKYTLNANALYGVDETIEVYNVLGRGLLLFTVLPDFYSDSNWSVIDSAEAQQWQLKAIHLKYIHRHPYFNTYPGQTKTLDFKLVKEVDGQFYVSNVCLTEIFLPMKYHSAETPAQINSIQGVLNIRQPQLTIKQMMVDVWPNLEVFKGKPFVMDFRERELKLPNQHNFMREYLSKSMVLKGDTVYQFWLFAGWNTRQGYDEVWQSHDGEEAYYFPSFTSFDNPSFHRGIDRMLYIPGKGVVGGSYDFYFIQPYTMEYKGYAKPRPRTTKSKEELFQNMLEERVMLAEELK